MIAATRELKYSLQQLMAAGNEGIDGRFPCNVCGKSYLRKRHLQRHIRDECIGIPPRFKCDLCPSRFRRKYHMVRHMSSKHGIQTPMPMPGPRTSSLKKENFENEMIQNAEAYQYGNSSGFAATQPMPTGRPPSVKKENIQNGNYGPNPIALHRMNMKKENLNETNPNEFDPKDTNKISDDWKMKLSLQLISDSLLKERLMNALPFAYNNN